MKDDSAPPSGGVGSSRWKELIEVASPISGRELDPTLPRQRSPAPCPCVLAFHRGTTQEPLSGGAPCYLPPFFSELGNSLLKKGGGVSGQEVLKGESPLKIDVKHMENKRKHGGKRRE